MWENITEKQKKEYNSLVTHPLQAYEWGVFREKTGIQVVRKGRFEKGKLTESFQLTLHPIPHTKYTIGYLPKGSMPSKDLLQELRSIGKQYNCIFIQLEPNIPASQEIPSSLGLQKAAHPLFTKYTFQLDLTKSEEDILKHMNQKTRYNIKVAQKHNVAVQEENTKVVFDRYWELSQETTKRQGFYAHTKEYHKDQWDSLPHSQQKNTLSSHLFVAKYNQEILTAWVLFVFNNTLYYPYGASSSSHRETMSSNLMMWEAIRYGKKLGLKKFDMWGSLGENPDPQDPWFGFHKFKQGYGAELVEFVGSFDLVITPLAYQGFKLADKLRWLLLRMKK